MRYIIVLVWACTTLLVGCAENNNIRNLDSIPSSPSSFPSSQFSDESYDVSLIDKDIHRVLKTQNFLLTIPSEVSHPTYYPYCRNNYCSFSNDTNDNDLDRISEYRIQTYLLPFSQEKIEDWQKVINENFSDFSCSPSLTGASTTTPLPNANGTAEWGRVDFFEKYAGEGYVDYMGETPLCAEPGSAKDRYALCSHKDGKTVVICISQMTQNEPLAKQIFDTFRWTK